MRVQMETTPIRNADPIVADFWSALLTQRAVLRETQVAIGRAELLDGAVRRTSSNPFTN